MPDCDAKKTKGVGETKKKVTSGKQPTSHVDGDDEESSKNIFAHCLEIKQSQFGGRSRRNQHTSGVVLNSILRFP